ncbi:conserved hypothetical protein [Streptomyces pristinaespiralis ATCC 25486]|uniref:Uncharacterized protein n=1 Tax=Streptomyces pristinaespiralis (strain ATCC 25486 / DSM 40338 / CBS 914.69 / JCM 4507 / KCC S-0507 / NBRC 13074 / NRRL 2958 / 5647) TaxID=457429 RepID=D6X892_STRE2|nr:conserved hypothetical protein [Streptomyces pristinaespiralis ATCC 25486]
MRPGGPDAGGVTGDPGQRPCGGRVSTCERGLLRTPRVCLNGVMASIHRSIATGRTDLEPFWPSRQHHDFDRVCCRA